MSTLNAALTYKLQKMERTLSSLMEENRALRTMINEFNTPTTPAGAYASGGGQALGQYLAGVQQPSVGGMGRVAGGMSPTSTTTGGGLMSGGMGSAASGAPATTQAMRSLGPVPGAGGQGLGAFLAGFGINANDPNAQVPISVLNTLFNSPGLIAGGMQSAQGSGIQTTQRRR